MTALPQFSEMRELNILARAASDMGYEIVDIAGFLDLVEAQARQQRSALSLLEKGTADIHAASTAVQSAAGDLEESVERTAADAHQSTKMVRTLGEHSNHVAEWVQNLSERSHDVTQTLHDAKDNNAQIASIAMQVNTLAINAKIEAARAGDAGRGFAVVAEAINELSRKTKDAAAQISTNIDFLTKWITTLGIEAGDIANSAGSIIAQSEETDAALNRMELSITNTKEQASRIAIQSGKVHSVLDDFAPSVHQIGQSTVETTDGIEKTHARVERLIDTSESIVQSGAALGGMTDDAPFIAYVRDRAARVSAAFESALDSGQITRDALFDRAYVPVANSNPQQVTTAYTDLLDRILPPIQEPALDFDPKVVFLRGSQCERLPADPQQKVFPSPRPRSGLEHGQLQEPAHL